MTIPTFTPPVPPSVGTSGDTSYRSLTARFGDGVQQDTPDGVDNDTMTATMVLEMLDEDQFQEVKTFMRLNNLRFYWTYPGETDPRLWKCTKLSDNPLTGGLHNVSMPLEEVRA